LIAIKFLFKFFWCSFGKHLLDILFGSSISFTCIIKIPLEACGQLEGQRCIVIKVFVRDIEQIWEINRDRLKGIGM